MRVNLIPIGSSRGIRLPKPILELCGARSGFELEIQGRTLVLHPLHPRADWEATFAQSGDDSQETESWTW
ncbi:MAG TPA: AbrB/MazE/SpoVT family DNA-binding domain-containing protein [Methylothermaceae bacterium]|nr:AbrB/MazE/SpoVT family DNA-binding domain-containing protein [Methylothermaceae bacterium]